MKRYLISGLVALLVPVAALAAEDELLPADEAFALSTRVADAHTLEAIWKIAPGYYLYRRNFKFEPLDDSVKLGPTVLPHGKQKDDPTFGKVEIYQHWVTAKLPLAQRPGGAFSARLKITAQGCNEPVGVCYPPIVKEVSFKLPALPGQTAAVPAPAAAAPLSLTDMMKASGPAAVGDTEAPTPDQVFHATVAADGATLLARLDIDDCCYLYRDKTKIELADAPAGVQLGDYTLPPGKVKTDPFIGKTEIYHQGFDVRVPVQGAADKTFDAALRLTYQGCAEKGVTICYPPVTKVFRVSTVNGILRVAPEEGGAMAGEAAAPRDVKALVLAMLGAFAVGLGLAFTPCVLPMIPIVSGAIVRSGDTTLGKLRGGLLSYTYVLGTAVTYTIAGALAGATGEQLQAYFQNPWAIGTFAAILALMALSMFGLYELQMPSFIQSRLHYHTHKIKGGSFIGVFILGIVSALIVGACVSPVLISLLSAAMASHDPVLGGGIMFGLAHGQGMILVLLGVGAGFLLPKAGHWMDKVKHVFGVMLLGVAIYLLGFLPQVPVLLLWASLFIVTGVYLGATESLPHGSNGWRYLWKGIGTVFLIWGVLALLGGMAGNRDILSPLPLTGNLIVGAPAQATSAPSGETKLFTRVGGVGDIEGQLAQAKSAGKPVMVDYYADWCTDCRRMENTTFRDPRVREALQRFLRLQADVTDAGSPVTADLKKRFGVFGPPAMIFIDSDGSQRKELRTYGYRNPEQFLALIGRVR